VCSDGLTDVVGDDLIGSLLVRYSGLEAAVELWRAAMQAGGPDNITVAVVELIEADEPS
jgi:serine/threonine protein phosphatase PrpC